MREQIARIFPGNEKGFDRYHRYESAKLAKIVPCFV